MNFINTFHESISGYIFFPLLNYLYNRKNILPTYYSSLKIDTTSPEHQETIQVQRLKIILHHAYTYVPYYTKLFKKIQFSPSQFTSLKQLDAIPPLSRDLVLEQYRDMVDIRFQSSIQKAMQSKKWVGEPELFSVFKKHKLIRNTSSGSTGTPTTFFEDGAISASNWANELRIRHWFGINPGAKEARFTRSSIQYLPKANKILFRKLLWNQLLLPGVNLSEENYELCYNCLVSFKPRVLWGFTSSLVEFARFIKATNKNINALKPKLCITWAAPLHDFEKQTLESVFQCPISNIYGSREIGHIAALCKNSTFHLFTDSVYTEIDSQNFNKQDSACGEILATTLQISPMPFIRYKMGDIGSVHHETCTCGLQLPILQSFHGRTGEVFFTKDGRMIAPNFWCRTFMHPELAEAVKQFQVIYTKDKNIRIKLVKNTHYTSATETFLAKILASNFSNQTPIFFDYVDVIHITRSNKYEMVINEAQTTCI